MRILPRLTPALLRLRALALEWRLRNAVADVIYAKGMLQDAEERQDMLAKRLSILRTKLWAEVMKKYRTP